MPIIRITAADLQRGKTLEAGWYGSKITEVKPLAPSADAKSMNMVVVFTIDKTDGKTIEHYYNSKGWFGVAETHKSATGKELVIESGGSFDLDSDEWVGKQVDVKLVTNTYNGRLVNNIEGWLPYGQGANQKPPFFA